MIVNFAWDLPFGPKQRWLADTAGNPGKWILARIVGGWSATGVFNWHSGIFFTPTYGGYDAGNINQLSGRPDVVAGCDPYTGLAPLRSSASYFKAECFKAPANGTLGNAKAFSLEGPAMWVFNLSPFKEFRLPGIENGKLRIGAWFYNILNNGAYWSHASGSYGNYVRQPDGSLALTSNPSGTYLTPWYVRRGTEGVSQRAITFAGSVHF
jgi:hypothetical protein